MFPMQTLNINFDGIRNKNELKDKLISNTSIKTSHLKPIESDGEFS